MDERIALRQEARRREVLDGAMDVFSEQGYRATSMRDIADRVGMGKASLYHYVSSKEEVLIDLYEEVLQQGVGDVKRVVESDIPTVDALAEIIRSRVSYTCENRALLRIFFEEEAELPRRQQARLISFRRQYEDAIIGLIKKGIEQDDLVLPTTPRLFVNTILGAANWTYKWYDENGRLSPDELGREMTAVLLAGVTTS